jgi:hypothetical protein
MYMQAKAGVDWDRHIEGHGTMTVEANQCGERESTRRYNAPERPAQREM